MHTRMLSVNAHLTCFMNKAAPEGGDRRLWLSAYIATVFIPWLLIFARFGLDAACIWVDAAFLYRSWRRREYAWQADPVFRVGLAAWMWLLFSTLFSQSPLMSLGISAVWIRYVLFYAALRYWVLSRPEALRFLGNMFTVMLALIAFDTIWQYIFGVSLTGNVSNTDGRLTGPLTNVKVGIFVAKLLLPVVAIYTCFSLNRRKALTYALAAGVLIVSAGIIMLAGERTAFLSLTLGVTLMTGVAGYYDRPRRVMYLIIFGLYIALMEFLLLTQPAVQWRVANLVDVLANYHGSNYEQLHSAGYEIGKRHWLTGAGLKSFRQICPGLIKEGLVSYCNLHPHNIYIEWFAEAGLPGLLLFIGMIGAFLREAWRAIRLGVNRLAAIAALATLFINFFPFMPTQSFFSNWPAMLLWYSISIAMASAWVSDDRAARG